MFGKYKKADQAQIKMVMHRLSVAQKVVDETVLAYREAGEHHEGLAQLVADFIIVYKNIQKMELMRFEADEAADAIEMFAMNAIVIKNQLAA